MEKYEFSKKHDEDDGIRILKMLIIALFGSLIFWVGLFQVVDKFSN